MQNPRNDTSEQKHKAEVSLRDFAGFGAREQGSYLEGSNQAPSEQSHKITVQSHSDKPTPTKETTL